MKKRWKIVFFLMVSWFSLFGCVKRETVEKEDKSEEVRVQEIEQIEDVISPLYKGNTVLTEDNMEEVLKTFLSIADKKELIKLENLPLTENFFKECVEDFHYVEGMKEYKEINIEFWSIVEEEKFICLVDFCKENNPQDNAILCKPDHVYFIEMKVIDNKIDGMKMEIIR